MLVGTGNAVLQNLLNLKAATRTTDYPSSGYYPSQPEMKPQGKFWLKMPSKIWQLLVQ